MSNRNNKKLQLIYQRHFPLPSNQKFSHRLPHQIQVCYNGFVILLLTYLAKTDAAQIRFTRFTAKDREEMWKSSKNPYHDQGCQQSSAIQLK
jgi:hypothetical protein